MQIYHSLFSPAETVHISTVIFHPSFQKKTRRWLQCANIARAWSRDRARWWSVSSAGGSVAQFVRIWQTKTAKACKTILNRRVFRAITIYLFILSALLLKPHNNKIILYRPSRLIVPHDELHRQTIRKSQPDGQQGVSSGKEDCIATVVI